MAKRVIEISNELEEHIKSAAVALGRSEGEIIYRAIEVYVVGVEPPATGVEVASSRAAGDGGCDAHDVQPERPGLLRRSGQDDFPAAFSRARFAIPDRLEDAVMDAAAACGMSQDEIVARAVERYLGGPAVIPPSITDPEEVFAAREAAAGMWKDRTDLPELDELRGEWDERLRRVTSDE